MLVPRTTLRVAAATLLAGLGSLTAPSPVEARSICRCGDATFGALGKDGYAALGLRLALDWERFDKDEGNPADEAESQVENRFTALLSYAFDDRCSLVARVPYSVRNLVASEAGAEPEEIHTSGWSDPEVYAQLRVWASPLADGVGQRASLSLTGGVKAPRGENDVREDG